MTPSGKLTVVLTLLSLAREIVGLLRAFTLKSKPMTQGPKSHSVESETLCPNCHRKDADHDYYP
jgi:cytochrome c553